MKTGAVVLALFATLACNAARIAGGATVPIGAEPRGAVVGTWVPWGCRDGQGAAVAPRNAAIRLVRKADARFVLVETRPAYDTVVVTNSFVAHRDRVFQLALMSSSSPPYLHEYQIPLDAGHAGRFAIVADDWDSRDAEGGFRAWYKKPAVECALLPVARVD